LSARDRVPDGMKTKATEPKKKEAKEEPRGKHRRIVSTDLHSIYSTTGQAGNITPETGSNQTAKTEAGSLGLPKKDEPGVKATRIEHRRVHSNIIEQMGNLPLSYSSFSKNKEAQELVKKYTSKLLRYKDIAFKRQKKPTEISPAEKVDQTSKKLSNSQKVNHKTSASKASTAKQTSQAPANLITNPSSVIQPSVKSPGFKKVMQKAVGKKGVGTIKPVKADPGAAMFGSAVDQMFSKTTVYSKHHRVQSGDFNGSLKGIKKEARGVSAERNSSWGANIKAKKLLLMNPDRPPGAKKTTNDKKNIMEVASAIKEGKFKQKPASAAVTKRKAQTDGMNSEPASVKNSGVNLQRIVPKESSVPKDEGRKAHISPALLKKVNHKKNISLPVSNPTTKLMENLNIPINMNFKGPTMTPDESRRTSPRNRTPRLQTPVQKKAVPIKQGSFIVEDDGEENQPEYYFSHLLYSRQRQDGKDKTEEATREIFLDFCADGDDSKAGESRPAGLNNTMNTAKSGVGSPFSPQGAYQSRENNTKPTKFAAEALKKIALPAGADQSRSRIEAADEVKLYSQQHSHRSRRPTDGAGPATSALPGPAGEEGFRAKNEVPLVLQKLMLLDKIKEHYGRETGGKDVATSLDFYQVIRRIGAGSFGKVYQAVSVLTGKEVAIKKFDKAEIKTELAKQKIFQEAKILTMLDHPNVARLLEVFENKGNIFCVMEFAKEGDLLDLIKARGPLAEDIARFVTVQVAHGLKHCHGRGVLHRDVKLDNVLLSANFVAKICDFGISRVVRPGEVMREDCGTPAYTAPEVVAGAGYSGFQADVWSLGVMLFVMVTGKVPFKDAGQSLDGLHRLIRKGEFAFPAAAALSADLRDLISRMLVVDPAARLTVDEVLGHAWFRRPVIDQLTAYIRGGEAAANDDYAVKRLLELGFPEAAVRRAVDHRVLNHVHCCYQIYRLN
jgi:tRNA A-37 threonylcarbamoyl transferase component Bud32